MPESKRKSTPTVQGAADFLRAHDRMAYLLPAAMRLAALQKECTAVLPEVFKSCEVLQFDAGQITLAVPNAAFAAKLKQKLPNLQDALRQRGWQVNGIRLKVQVRQPERKQFVTKKPELPVPAVSAWAQLSEALEDTPANAALKAAIKALVQRQRKD